MTRREEEYKDIMIANFIIGVGAFLWAMSIYFGVNPSVTNLLFVSTLLLFTLRIVFGAQRIIG